ncbi:MAG: amidohydrolase family protein [Clostridia bacterium]|nr:amidohydrolase family protein [Clostridia bacterium]
MLIDFHTHCFPDKIYEKAIQKLQAASGNMEIYSDGSLSGLKNSMKENGVDISVVLNIATNAHQQKSVNDFAASINNGKDIFSFGSVFPGSDDVLDELERIKALGMKGVKFHPDYQGFEIDDPVMKPIYKKVSQLGLIAVFHAGFDYGFPPPYKAMPKAMARAASWIDSPVVAAHWGGINCGDDVLKYLCGGNLYFDLSFGYCMMPKIYAKRIIEKHGIEKLLFGTDNPWHNARLEMRLLTSLGLEKYEMDSITHQNAMKLLGINHPKNSLK